MVKHIILWKLNDDLEGNVLKEVKDDIKIHLENLKEIIPGLLNIKVHNDSLPSSTADLMLYTEFDSVESLKAYSKNPDHVSVANRYVRPYTKTMLCLDFKD